MAASMIRTWRSWTKQDDAGEHGDMCCCLMWVEPNSGGTKWASMRLTKLAESRECASRALTIRYCPTLFSCLLDD